MKKFYLLLTIFCSIALASTSQPPDSIGKLNRNDELLNKKLTEINDDLRTSINSLMADSNLLLNLKVELSKTNANEVKKTKELRNNILETEKRFLSGKKELFDQIKLLRTIVSGIPIAPFSDTLYFIYTNLGPFSPQERAESLNTKIRNIYSEENFNPDSLTILQTNAFSNILYKKVIITSASDMDALWNGTNRLQLAHEWKEQIGFAILKEFEENSLANILMKVSIVLVTIILLSIAIYLVNKLFSWIRKKFIENRQNPAIKSIKLRDYELLSEDTLTRYLLRFISIIKIALIIVLVYFSLPFILKLFPYTKGHADILLGWVLSPLYKIFLAIKDYVPNLITIVVIVFVTRYIMKFLKHLANEIKSGKLHIPNFYPDWALPTFNIIRFLLYAFMFIVIFPYLPGSDSPVFKGVSVFLGILISFGSSSAISNAVAGIVITYMRPFKIGDRIKVGDYSGDVIEKSILMTRIRTVKNEEITIPNSTILSGQTINFTTFAKESGLILHTSVTIGYDVPWRDMQAALLEAANRTSSVLKEPKPFVLQTSLDDFYISYQLNVYTREASRQMFVYSELHANILDSCNEAGIEIMSPHYRAERDGNAITIPKDYQSKGNE